MRHPVCISKLALPLYTKFKTDIMEEIEIPTEHLHEAIHEQAEEAREKRIEKEWSMAVAISTAIMAVFAAISGLLAGDYVNEAMIQQIKASDQWAYYQAKGIKAEIKGLKNDTSGIARYKAEQKEISQKANEFTEESEVHLKKHVQLSRAVTFFQVSIAISAISILSKKRFLWFVALALSIGGIVFFVMGLT